MQITLLAAVDEDQAIGRTGGGLPWHVPGEVAQFRARAAGPWLLVGRRTFEEMRGWFQPGQTALVVTRRPAGVTSPALPVPSVAAALHHAETMGAAEVLVLGGAEIFAAVLPRATRLILSRLHLRSGGDVFFPAWNPAEWEEIARDSFPPISQSAHAFTVSTFARRSEPRM